MRKVYEDIGTLIYKYWLPVSLTSLLNNTDSVSHKLVSFLLAICQIIDPV